MSLNAENVYKCKVDPQKGCLYVAGNITSLRFETAAQRWLLSIAPRVKESTQVKYSNLLRSYILPNLGMQAIQTLTHEKLESVCNNLLVKGGTRGTGLSPKTVSDCLTLIRSILRHSANCGIPPLCNGKSIAIKQHFHEMRVLSHSEQERLCQYLYKHFNERNMGILICLFMGLRIGEICALKWENISFIDQTLCVQYTMQRIQNQNSKDKKTKILVTPPKSACSIRTIPIPDALFHLLSGCRKPESAYILTGAADRYVEPRTMQNHFRQVLQACAIESANYHSLRHTFATRCVELGFDIKSLSEILGHASVTITMNRYVHPSMELKRQNMMRLSSIIAAKQQIREGGQTAGSYAE